MDYAIVTIKDTGLSILIQLRNAILFDRIVPNNHLIQYIFKEDFQIISIVIG
jgi:hypothetical protein